MKKKKKDLAGKMTPTDLRKMRSSLKCSKSREVSNGGGGEGGKMTGGLRQGMAFTRLKVGKLPEDLFENLVTGMGDNFRVLAGASPPLPFESGDELCFQQDQTEPERESEEICHRVSDWTLPGAGAAWAATINNTQGFLVIAWDKKSI